MCSKNTENPDLLSICCKQKRLHRKINGCHKAQNRYLPVLPQPKPLAGYDINA